MTIRPTPEDLRDYLPDELTLTARVTRAMLKTARRKAMQYVTCIRAINTALQQQQQPKTAEALTLSLRSCSDSLKYWRRETHEEAALLRAIRREEAEKGKQFPSTSLWWVTP